MANVLTVQDQDSITQLPAEGWPIRRITRKQAGVGPQDGALVPAGSGPIGDSDGGSNIPHHFDRRLGSGLGGKIPHFDRRVRSDLRSDGGDGRRGEIGELMAAKLEVGLSPTLRIPRSPEKSSLRKCLMQRRHGACVEARKCCSQDLGCFQDLGAVYAPRPSCSCANAPARRTARNTVTGA